MSDWENELEEEVQKRYEEQTKRVQQLTEEYNNLSEAEKKAAFLVAAENQPNPPPDGQAGFPQGRQGKQRRDGGAFVIHGAPSENPAVPDFTAPGVKTPFRNPFRHLIQFQALFPGNSLLLHIPYWLSACRVGGN